jgi:hypothetical protein
LSAFEFFFTLYGLVLGLSVVEIVAGISRLAHDSRGVRIGVLTPLLALALLTDLAGFWLSARPVSTMSPPRSCSPVICRRNLTLTRSICAIAGWC